jgi:hypothetical protein
MLTDKPWVHGKVKCGEVNKVEPLIARLHQMSMGKRGKSSLFGYHLIGGQRWEKSLKLSINLNMYIISWSGSILAKFGF